MLTKIGDSWVDLAEVEAAIPNSFETTVSVYFHSGQGVSLYVSPETFEAALHRAGVVAGGEDINVPGSIPEEELPKLLELYNAGFGFLARDGDGKVYAYRNRPRRDGAYWDPATHDDGEVVPLGREAFPFVEEAEPFDIRECFGPDVRQPDICGPGSDES